jgi:hypothetical protein
MGPVVFCEDILAEISAVLEAVELNSLLEE